VTRGGYRAAVFGVSDGLVSNVALILGVAGASSGQELVRIAGLAGLIAGAVSALAGAGSDVIPVYRDWHQL